MFEVGQSVVCVNAEDQMRFPGEHPMIGLTQGAHYTVREVFVERLTLWETQNADSEDEEDYGYYHSRFSPVAKRSDTLSIESFLVIKPGFEEPRREQHPAPVRRVKKGVGV